jgi:OOP family OmpA-OmpF porin
MFQYTNLTIGIDLGKDAIDPLWTVNPLDYLYATVQEIDPDNLLKDSDNDGVIDRLDKEPNTPEGTPVDTHGVGLDSDKDGCPDSEDPEPFSSPVLPMENCQNVHVTMQEVKEYVDKRIADMGGTVGGAVDWYLPMIFFDLNKADIRPDAVPELEYVAEIMKRYNKLTVEVVGHTDTRASEDYNLKLSENRAKSAINYLVKKGVTESRLKIVYKGESAPLIEGTTLSEEQHQQNRRVEFHIVKN